MKRYKFLHVLFVFVVVFSVVCLNVYPVFASSGVNFSKDQLHIQQWGAADRNGTYEGLESYLVSPPAGGYYFGVKETNLYQNQIFNYSFKGSNKFNMQIGPMYVSSMGDTQFWEYDFDISFFDNGYFLDLSGLDNQCKILVDFQFNIIGSLGDYSIGLQPKVSPLYVTYYDINGNVISTQTGNAGSYSYIPYYGFPYYEMSSSVDLELPSNAKYCSLSMMLTDFGISSDQFCTFDLSATSAEILIAKPTKLIIQNYQNIGTVVDENKFQRSWLIENNANIGSADLKSTDPSLSTSSGTNYNTFNFVALPGESYKYNLTYRMFYPNRLLTLDNIPVGTTIGVVADFHINANVSWFYPYAQIMITYYNENFTALSDASQHCYFGRDYSRIDNNTGGSLSTNFVLDYPDDAKYMAVNLYLQDFYNLGSSSANVTATCDKFEFWVGESLVITEFPDGSDLGDLSGGMEVYHPDINDIKVNISEFLEMNGFLMMSTVLSIFWQSSFLNVLVTLVALFVLVSWIFFGQK